MPCRAVRLFQVRGRLKREQLKQPVGQASAGGCGQSEYVLFRLAVSALRHRSKLFLLRGLWSLGMSADTLLCNIPVSFIPLTRSKRAYLGFEDAWTLPPYSNSPHQCLCPEHRSPLGSRSHINFQLLGKNWGAAGRNGILNKSINRSSPLLHRI